MPVIPRLVLTTLALQTGWAAASPTIAVLHTFGIAPGIKSDGASPLAGLVLSGNTLYGTTTQGGPSGAGTIFSINTDGTGYQQVYTFGDGLDGGGPASPLVYAGGVLYGTTTNGGAANYGTIFSVDTNGNCTTLYSFTNGVDGARPTAGMVLAGGMLYGTAGPYPSASCVFEIPTNGGSLTILHQFAYSDGSYPLALTLSGGYLYGAASDGGVNGTGTIFKMPLGLTNFTRLYSFTNTVGFGTFDNSTGAYPSGGLAILGGNLYGLTEYGGEEGYGTVYEATTNAAPISLLSQFAPTTNAYYSPAGTPTIVGTNLYATTLFTIFSVGVNGGGFTNVAFFEGTNYSGTYSNVVGVTPNDGFVVIGKTLYGTALNGGTMGEGTVFALNLLPPIPLNIRSSAGQIVLTWTNAAFGLQGSGSVNGPFTNVPGATSPYTAPITGSMFFRLEGN